MSTRCAAVIIDGNKESQIFYRHWDGYPNAAGEELLALAKSCEWDYYPIVESICSDGSDVPPQYAKLNIEYPDESFEYPKGILMDDLDYFYVVDCTAKEVRCYSDSYGKNVRDWKSNLSEFTVIGHNAKTKAICNHDETTRLKDEYEKAIKTAESFKHDYIMLKIGKLIEDFNAGKLKTYSGGMSMLQPLDTLRYKCTGETLTIQYFEGSIKRISLLLNAASGYYTIWDTAWCINGIDYYPSLLKLRDDYCPYLKLDK